jgi:nicotinate-nucleotide adenylyltransferase
MRVGLLGGTFDPVHVGHLIVAQDVIEELRLDRMVFIPCSIPPHKEAHACASAEDRFKMLRIAIVNNMQFVVSDVELVRGGVSYTVDTVIQLQQQGWGDHELFFVMGSDQAMEIESWKDPARLLEVCRIVVISRPGYDLGILPSLLEGNALTVVVRAVDVSSSEIRERVAYQRSIRYLVPREVGEYIHNHGLYR